MGQAFRKFKRAQDKRVAAWEDEFEGREDSEEALKAHKSLDEARETHLAEMAAMLRDVALENGGFQVKVCQMLSIQHALLSGGPRGNRTSRRYSAEATPRGATWIFRGGGSRRRRGHNVDSPWRRVAAPPRAVT